MTDSPCPPAPFFLRRALRSRLSAGQLRLLTRSPGRRPAPSLRPPPPPPPWLPGAVEALARRAGSSVTSQTPPLSRGGAGTGRGGWWVRGGVVWVGACVLLGVAGSGCWCLGAVRVLRVAGLPSSRPSRSLLSLLGGTCWTRRTARTHPPSRGRVVAHPERQGASPRAQGRWLGAGRGRAVVTSRLQPLAAPLRRQPRLTADGHRQPVPAAWEAPRGTRCGLLAVRGLPGGGGGGKPRPGCPGRGCTGEGPPLGAGAAGPASRRPGQQLGGFCLGF